jgi:transmembrane sensor
LDEAGDAERMQIEEGLSADAGFRSRFEQFKKVWEASLQLAQDAATDENAAWQRFKNRVTYKQQTKAPVKINWMKAAAAVFILVCIGVTASLLINTYSTPKEIVFQTTEQVLNDTLPDASVITLNKNTSLTYPEKFKGNTRTVALKGEAFFSITPDKQKPFIIAVNNLQVKVVGTSFNIKATGAVTEVVVETGIVQVIKDNQLLELRAGEKAVLSGDAASWVKEKTNDKLYNYYRSKEFVCDNTPLWKLVEVLNEAYGSNIVIGNNAIRNLPITTTFYNESLDQVLLIISETLNIQVIKKDNSRILQ